MKLFILFSFLSLGVAFAEPRLLTVSDLTYFSGDWNLVNGSLASEMYIAAPVGGVIMGMDRNIDGKLVTFAEFFKMEDSDGKVLLRPYPFDVLAQGKVPVVFTLNQDKSVPKNAVFENPTNDWPQTITYTFSDDGKLTLTVEGIKPSYPPKVVTEYIRWKR